MSWKPVPKPIREHVFSRSGGRCWYCGCDLDPHAFDVDHFVPVSVGGGEGDNLVPACKSCNSSKRNRSLDEFRAIRKRQRDGVPLFTLEQHEWLAEQGFRFPETAPYRFWFERELQP